MATRLQTICLKLVATNYQQSFHCLSVPNSVWILDIVITDRKRTELDWIQQQKLNEYGQIKSSKSGDWFACRTFLSRQLLQSFAMAAHRREWKAHNYNYVIFIRCKLCNCNYVYVTPSWVITDVEKMTIMCFQFTQLTA